uniref:Uncharacterized protein n=1 Tax=Tetranychus urticae TaxID=32264 RepID=T1KUV7_TETUR
MLNKNKVKVFFASLDSSFVAKVKMDYQFSKFACFSAKSHGNSKRPKISLTLRLNLKSQLFW